MRGRTLNHAFVILDEAQNTTREQMKMFLTRIGFGSKCVVTGDTSQIDLPKGMPSGLVDADAMCCSVWPASASRTSPPTTWCATRWWRASSRPTTARRTVAWRAASAMKPPLQLSLQFADGATARNCRATACALDARRAGAPAQIAVRIVDEDEGRALNRDRGKDYATNVLTFDYEREPVVVADLVLCAPVVGARAAAEQASAAGALRAPAGARRAARPGLGPRSAPPTRGAWKRMASRSCMPCGILK
jgi:ssRNA-specific RNase YbeY (16S rRNA maturation enzyme)